MNEEEILIDTNYDEQILNELQSQTLILNELKESELKKLDLFDLYLPFFFAPILLILIFKLVR